MAKSPKKSEASEKSQKQPAATKAGGKAGEAKPQAAKAAPAKSAKPAGAKPAHQSKPMMSPLIDTSHIASSAARMLVAGVGGKNQQKQPQASKQPESSLFKQMKSGLNKPHSAQMDSLLDKTHGPGGQKTQGFEKQVAHNQTVGTDATRKSVPRRTAG
ncbi:MAG: hypothetical protein H7Z14_11740 [Anaerolineae bacterium]|nr:hypothetical protein [Phycisphaerae bacterium]